MRAIAVGQSELAASSDLIGIGPLLTIGLLFAIGLVVARLLYMRRKREEPPVPAEQPRHGAWQTREELDRECPPDHGPGHQEGPPPREYDYDTDHTAPEEVRPDGRRYYPSELGNDYRTSRDR